MSASPSSRRKLHAEDTRRAILGHARQQFGANGFAKTSLHEIAADAGVTIGAVYHHFGSKAKLFDEVFVDIERELRDLSNAAARRKPNDSVTDRLLRSFKAYLTAIEDPALYRVVFIDAPAVLGVERCDEVFDTYGRSGIRAGLDHARQQGMHVVGGVDSASRLVFGALVAAPGPADRAGNGAGAARRNTMKALAALLGALVVPAPAEPSRARGRALRGAVER
jgi:AcrR family transcriptional regulator